MNMPAGTGKASRDKHVSQESIKGRAPGKGKTKGEDGPRREVSNLERLTPNG